jgi:hypothetical protein
MLRTASILLAAGLFGGGPTYFEVSAKYEAAAKGEKQGAVLVSFLQTEAGVHVNETPAPRLELDAEQVVLDYKAPVTKPAAVVDPALAKKLDLSQPVRFPVTLRAGAPKGEQAVKGTVVYFYCSDHEGWCRKGTADFNVSVSVP